MQTTITMAILQCVWIGTHFCGFARFNALRRERVHPTKYRRSNERTKKKSDPRKWKLSHKYASSNVCNWPFHSTILYITSVLSVSMWVFFSYSTFFFLLHAFDNENNRRDFSSETNCRAVLYIFLVVVEHFKVDNVQDFSKWKTQQQKNNVHTYVGKKNISSHCICTQCLIHGARWPFPLNLNFKWM